jgi:cytochrome c oxidase cbb3-type subunit III
METRDQIIDHGSDYDGIKEYDNPLPNWFLYMFYGCIVFAFFYSGYYFGKSWALSNFSGVGSNLAWSGSKLKVEMDAIERAKAAAPFETPVGEALNSFLRNSGNISRGEALFKANCVACHGEHGQGVVGPNLTDAYWIHGNKPEDLVNSIQNGWLPNGMPAWGPSLGAQKVHWLTAYVMSIRGKPVENPKAPQGEKLD